MESQLKTFQEMEEKWTETLQQSSKKKKSLAISNLEDLIAAKGTKFLGCFRAK
ncbi:hypothetical protein ADUPG1_012413, partial [Aduncisulcus paluster]